MPDLYPAGTIPHSGCPASLQGTLGGRAYRVMFTARWPSDHLQQLQHGEVLFVGHSYQARSAATVITQQDQQAAQFRLEVLWQAVVQADQPQQSDGVIRIAVRVPATHRRVGLVAGQAQGIQFSATYPATGPIMIERFTASTTLL